MRTYGRHCPRRTTSCCREPTSYLTSRHEILGITIKPEAVDPDDIEMLEDLVAAAVNATVKQVDETAEAEMGKLTGGLNIPGL